MRKFLVSVVTFGILISCVNDDNVSEPDIVGKWQLVQELIDPGDGREDFAPVDSELMLEFFDNGTVVSVNGSLCNFSTPSNDSSSGTFSVKDKTIAIGCEDDVITISFEIGEDLILRFGCIEQCAQKYQRIL